MTAIPAEVVAAHRLLDQYHVIVRIGAAIIEAHSPHLFLETTSRSSVLVTTVGLILFTFSIPDFKQAKSFRCGRFSNRHLPRDAKTFSLWLWTKYYQGKWLSF